MLDKIKRTTVDKRDRNTNVTIETLKQKLDVKDTEIRDYLDYLVENLDNFKKNTDNFPNQILEKVFPIGATYITQEEVNPSSILEFGTWERLKGKVTVGLDEEEEQFNEIGKEGGEKTHTLTNGEMPKHGHSSAVINPNNAGHEAAAYGYEYTSSSNGVAIPLANTVGKTTKGWISSTLSNYQGNNQSHNNLQPYRVVGYMWIRIA